MALKRNDGELYIAQCNGTGDSTENCEANYGPDRGPRFINLKNTLESDIFGRNYGIVRIRVSGSGNISCGIVIKVYGYYHSYWPDGERDYESDNGSLGTWEAYTGTLTGNSFSATYSKTPYDITYSGTINAVFSEDHNTIISLSWSQTESSPTCTGSESVEVKNIPLAYEPYYGAKLYQLKGEICCDHILSVTNTNTCPEGLCRSMENHSCTSGSEIYISFTDESVKSY